MTLETRSLLSKIKQKIDKYIKIYIRMWKKQGHKLISIENIKFIEIDRYQIDSLPIQNMVALQVVGLGTLEVDR